MTAKVRALLGESYLSPSTNARLVEYTVGGLLAERARTHRDVAALVGPRHGDGPVDVVEQLHAHSRKYLTPQKIPQRWFIADDLPRTTTAKVRKFAPPDLIAQGSVCELSREEPHQ
jgi:acyl-CoA synthetase (AMP-forming)/AMP-acid ligase II